MKIRATKLTAIASAIQKLLGTFTPQSLFTSGVNGAWYDPVDFSTMFQNAAGTVPVTAVGQPVGLMLDKSKGLVLGSEVTTNGSFATDTAWTKGAGWSISGDAARTDGTQGTTSYIQQGINGPAGIYLVSVVVTANSGSLRFDIGSNTSGNITGIGVKTAILTKAPSTTTQLYIGAAAGVTCVIDSISVRELPGNHAYNPSGNSANFPVLSARYNLLTKTEQFDDATWRTTAAFTTITGGFTDPNGTNNAFKLVGANKNIYQSISGLTAGTQVRFTIAIKADSSGTVTISNANGGVTPLTCNVTTNWQYFSLPFASVGSNDGPALFTNGTLSTIYAAFPDLRVANDALNQPAYQRVNTATEYDTVGFKPYLSFNGVNQWLQTNSIDFTYGDNMFVSAGVRKLSDAAAGILTELSASAAANNGVFTVSGPSFAGGAVYAVWSKGTTLVAPTAYSIASPNTSLISGIADISAPSAIIRVNGLQKDIVTTTQGTGNYGNYPLYIGARAGTSLFFNGRLYGLVVAGKSASASEIANTESFLGLNTGFTKPSITGSPTIQINL